MGSRRAGRPAFTLIEILIVVVILGILAALYSIYLFYVGIPVMMKTPDAKVIPYMVVAAVVVIVVMFVLGMFAALITGGSAMVAGAL